MYGRGMVDECSGEALLSGESVQLLTQTRSTHNMLQLIPAYIKMIKDNSDKIVFNPSFFEERESKAIENCPPIRAVKPIIDFDGQVKLGYNVGTRGNGRDKPHWPSDLMVEVVS